MSGDYAISAVFFMGDLPEPNPYESYHQALTNFTRFTSEKTSGVGSTVKLSVKPQPADFLWLTPHIEKLKDQNGQLVTVIPPTQSDKSIFVSLEDAETACFECLPITTPTKKNQGHVPSSALFLGREASHSSTEFVEISLE